MNVKKMNKQDYINWLVFVITIIIVLIVIGSAIFLVMGENGYDEMCLRNIAVEYCDEKGLMFKEVIIIKTMHPFFVGKEDFRSFDSKKFKFTNEELEGCKK